MPAWIYQKRSDKALLRAYAKGNSAAFECLYLRHKSSLFAFLRRQCGSSRISEELAQDAWLAVIQQAAHFKPEAAFRTWLFRIAHNKLIDHWRHNSNQDVGVFEELNNYLSDGRDPTVGALEVNDLIHSLEILSVAQLATLLLKIEGFSHSEIAEITQSKQETVKSRLRYAMKHMKSAMEPAL